MFIDPGLLQDSEYWIFINIGYVVDLENASGVGPATKRMRIHIQFGYNTSLKDINDLYLTDWLTCRRLWRDEIA